MNTRNTLLYIKGEECTKDVISCNYNSITKKYDVTFSNQKTYSYAYNNINKMIQPRYIQCNTVKVYYNQSMLKNIHEIYEFKPSNQAYGYNTLYWHIIFENQYEKTYPFEKLQVNYSCLQEKESNNCLSYLKQLSSINEMKGEDGTVLLEKQYDHLKFVDSNSVLAVYLNPKNVKRKTFESGILIFPFGSNRSQLQAVKNAMSNQFSVIQGPPGTGKTQTILNIIANLLIRNKTVLIVSNNNAATSNVYKKLLEKHISFFVAPLGNTENKKEFIRQQTSTYPVSAQWHLESDEYNNILGQVKKLSEELDDIFKIQRQLAQIRTELDDLNVEKIYFDQYCKDNKINVKPIRYSPAIKSDTLLTLWREYTDQLEKGYQVNIKFILNGIFFDWIWDPQFYKQDLNHMIAQVQGLYYIEHEKYLERKMSNLNQKLQGRQSDQKLNELTQLSLKLLHYELVKRYDPHSTRPIFTEDDLWKAPEKVLQEYPVVLSTTFSACKCLKDMTYDYLIMDEASQVDVATGALALSCAKNAVIVGDLQQLPNVVSNKIKHKSQEIFLQYNLDAAYEFAGNSFLKSVVNIIDGIPQSMLREHYRCHPQIINFCNHKFYHDQLIIMTKDHNEDDTLKVYKTVEGNHKRNHQNQRQTDVLIQEVLPDLKMDKPDSIGVIAPYREETEVIRKQLQEESDYQGIEVDTVHKYQGREKDTIIMTTVDDTVTDFSDDPYLLNVAVSRAKKKFYLIASGNEQPADSNIGDLISYIQYHNYEVVQSKIYSIFDLLYQQYTSNRIEFLSNNTQVSQYASENIMYHAIIDILKRHQDLNLKVCCHVPLKMLFREEPDIILEDNEVNYLRNSASHVDFLVYNSIRKIPIMGIEVDGFRFHENGTMQYDRDRMKDHIFELYGVKLLRFATNGSGEVDKIEKILDGIKYN